MHVNPWLMMASLAFLLLAVAVIFRRLMALTALVEKHLDDSMPKGFAAVKKMTEPIPEVLPPTIVEAKKSAP